MAEGSTGDTAGGESGTGPLPSRLRQSLFSLLGLRQNGASARAEIEDALKEDEASGAAFSPEERAMLRAILKLGDMRVDDVMVPRADIEAVDIETTVAGVLARFREAGHTRMPVYRESLDDPVGMVHLKDVTSWMLDLAAEPAATPAEPDAPAPPPTYVLSRVDLSRTLSDAGMMRSLLFVPPSMPARTLLDQMRARRIQMALVIDEYGGTEGLVSIEDLVEIIVGEIEDEHDEAEEAEVVRAADGSFIVDARAELSDITREIGPVFDEKVLDEVDTIGGLIFSTLGRIPVRGEIVQAIEGYEVEVLDADPRRVKRVRLRERRRPKILRQRERSPLPFPDARRTDAPIEEAAAASDAPSPADKTP